MKHTRQTASLGRNNRSKHTYTHNQRKNKILDLSELIAQFQYGHNSNQVKSTLKKPLKQMPIQLLKTNPYVHTHYQSYIQTKPNFKQKNNDIPVTKTNNWVHQDYQIGNNQKEEFRVINGFEKVIKPAYKQEKKLDLKIEGSIELGPDKNSIVAALLRKGQRIQDWKMNGQQKAKTDIKQKAVINEVGPAQRKLKALFKKQNSSNLKPTQNATKFKKGQIEQQINQSIDQYGIQSFQKFQQSAIKQSIRQSLNNSGSGYKQQAIKESIRQSIRQSFQERSFAEQIKQQIKQSLPESQVQIKESIPKSKESIEEVYEDIFEEQSIEQSANKSISGFKKSRDERRIELSDSQSKNFRKKTTLIKSIKIPQEMNIKISAAQNYVIETSLKDSRVKQQLDKQKLHLGQIKAKLETIINKKKQFSGINTKNANILYNLKIQINKLLTSTSFQYKLKRLTSFLPASAQTLPSVNLQQIIKNNIANSIANAKPNGITIQQVKQINQQLQNQYQSQLQHLLKVQEINLKAEMNEKLAERDLQLKKMIAELEKRFLQQNKQRRYPLPSFYKPQRMQRSQRNTQFQVDSDMSIQSNEISWKMDLWQMLPEYQKKKLYEKQTEQVIQFLTQVMMKEIKDQDLQRQLDISFQFPEGIENSSNFEDQKNKDESEHSRKDMMHQRKSQMFDFPPIKKKAQKVQNDYNWVQQNQKEQHQQIKKDNNLKSTIIKILSKYKPIYLKKKNDFIRKIVKTLQTKTKDPLNSILATLDILNEKDIQKNQILYVRAYEQTLVNQLVGIYTNCGNRKNNIIEQQMKKMYDRLIVTCQVQTAQKCSIMISLNEYPNKFNGSVKEKIKVLQQKPCPLQITFQENYINLVNKNGEKEVKNSIVNSIVQLLTKQFAKEFPKRKN